MIGTCYCAVALAALAWCAGDAIQTWPLVESVGIDWQHELVFFPLENREVKPGDEPGYSVVDENGRAVPFQFCAGAPGDAGPTTIDRISQVSVALLVDLPPWARRAFTMRRGGPRAPPPGDLQVRETAGEILIAAGRTAVRVGRAERFQPGAPLETLPGPLLAVRGVSGRWLGEGRLSGRQPVTKYSATVESRGPVFADAVVRYEFGPRKFHQFRLRLTSGEDVVLVDEDFALSEEELRKASFVEPPNLAPEIGQPSRYNEWLLRQGAGWKAIPTDVDKYPCFRFNFTKSWADRARGTGIGQARPAYQQADLAHAQEDWRLGLVLTPFQERGFRQNAVGFDRAPSGSPSAGQPGDYLGVFYCYGSRWVHPNENRVLMPWLDEGVVGHFTAHEGRRLWGMVVAEAGPKTDTRMVQHAGSVFGTIHRALVKFGETPLDKVKNWVLEWATPDARYPRLYVTPEGLQRVRRDYAGLSDEVKKLLAKDRAAHVLLTGDTATLRQEYEHHVAELRQSMLDFLGGGHNTPNTYTHRYQEVVRHGGRGLDMGLACPTLTAEERRRALAVVAFLAYKTSDRDYWPYHGYAGGPANPNMMTIAANALATCAGLAAGHPRQQQWLRLCERLTCADIDTSIGPAGEWLECPGYQGAGNTPMNKTVLILRNAGVVDLTGHPVYGRKLLAVSTYFANLLTPPDPRFDGRRMPMALGDNVPYFNNYFAYLAHSGRSAFPTEAAAAMWCFNQMGRPIGGDGLLLLHEHVLDGSVPEVPIDGRSKSFPAFGAMLRHGFGTKYETFLTYRQSDFAYGHYDDDQGSFSLFAKGAPLCLDWIDYSPGKAEHHNRVDYAEKYPWLVPPPDKVTLEAEADYVRSHEPQEPVWSRQLVLVKDTADPGDATYLVLRDMVRSEQPSTWNVWTLARKGSEQIAGPMARLEGQFGVDLALLFYRPLAHSLNATFLHHRTKSYLQMDQDQTRIQARCARGGDYGVVLYPLRRGKDVAPAVRELPSGAVEVAWPSGRRHLVFLFPESREAREGDNLFRGRAGVVKLDDGRRRLVPLECEVLK